MRKIPYEEVKHYIEKENDKECKLNTKKEDYIDTHQNLDLTCKCGNPFSSSYHVIKGRSKFHCDECGFKISGEKQRKNGQEVYDLFIRKNLIPQFNPEDYTNAKTKLPYVCTIHKDMGEQLVSYDNLKQKGACKYCKIDVGREKKKPEHKRIIENKGFIYVDSIYKNNVLYYQYKCPKHLEHGIQETSASNSIDQGCAICGREKQGISRRIKEDVVKDIFKQRDYEYHKENIYEGNTSRLKYKCNKHPELDWQETNYANIRTSKTCSKCIYESISGENHYLWKGGISPLHNYLRYKINDWKRNSLKEYGYCCGITGMQSNDLIVHHKYGFNLILDETLSELNLDIRSQVNLYSNEELQQIEKLLIEKHYEHGLGIPLLSYIHDIYHGIYGRGGNTDEEFNIFKEDFINGKYKYLEEVS